MKSRLNLLPAQFGRNVMIRNSLIQWACILFIAGAALTVWGLRQHARLVDHRDELAKLEARCVPIRETLTENRTISEKISNLHGRQTLLARLNRGEKPLQLVGQVSRCALFAGGGLKVSDMSYSISEVVQQPDPNQPSAEEKPTPLVTESIRLSLSGIAANDLAVSKFILSLRDCGRFSNVELKSSIRSKTAAGRARSFAVECTL